MQVPIIRLAPVVQTMDSAVHRINHYPADNTIGFASVYPLDSDLYGGQRYPSFEQLGPGSQHRGHTICVLYELRSPLTSQFATSPCLFPVKLNKSPRLFSVLSRPRLKGRVLKES